MRGGRVITGCVYYYNKSCDISNTRARSDYFSEKQDCQVTTITRFVQANY